MDCKYNAIFRNQFQFILLCIVWMLSDAGLLAQTRTMPRPTIQAHFIQNKPVIDGKILEDSVWMSINPDTLMWQSQPEAGSVATEKTAIRIAYTSNTLYIAAVCYDKSPEKLVASDNRRDAPLDGMDAFLFILDTYNDKQNGFVFGTNIMGSEYDAQVNFEGGGGFGGGRQQRGNIGGFNLNWDGQWVVKTKVFDYGWTAEFAIPFSTLRFAPGKNKTWGVNFRRNIQKNVEIDYWAQLPIEFNFNRLSLAGSLTNLNLPNPGNLKFIPYVLGSASNPSPKSGTEFSAGVGADVKYSITPSLTLDLTYNTDFAQVEVDDQQVNLNRFNLFFPEKRPFFLENAGQFSVGNPGEVDLFFSRRIGIGPGGIAVPILGGARLSGKINTTNVGLMSMFTQAVEEADIPANNFFVARVNHEFKSRSSIGALFVDKEYSASENNNFNRTFALDGRWGLGEKAQLSGFVAKTTAPDINKDNLAFRMQARYNWDGWILNADYTEVGKSFNPEVGFLRRSAFRKPSLLIFKRIRPDDFLGFLELRPHISYRGFWDFNGFQETGYLHIDNHWVWKNGLEIHTGINFTLEGVSQDFEIIKNVTVPKDTYRHREAQLVFRTNPSKMISISTFHRLGGFFGGKRYANTITLNFRFGDKLNSSFRLNNNIIRLPGGNFDTNLIAARLAYSFTPRIFAQALIQYNSVIDQWTSNIRFGWLHDANTGLFLVYNRARTGNFLIKYTKQFDLNHFTDRLLTHRSQLDDQAL